MKMQSATVTSVEHGEYFDSVNLEWGGPFDRTLEDFCTEMLGDVTACGGNLSSGWVILDGRTSLDKGATIPPRSDVCEHDNQLEENEKEKPCQHHEASRKGVK